MDLGLFPGSTDTKQILNKLLNKVNYQLDTYPNFDKSVIIRC